MYALVLLFFIASTSAFGTVTTKLPGKKSMVSIEKITAESSKEQSIVSISFSGKPESVQPVQEHGSFVQILVPNAIVPNPGQFFDGYGEHVAKIAAFQLTPKDAGIRVFLTLPAARIMNAVTTDVLDKRIVFMIDHKKILPAGQASSDIVKLDQKQLENAQLQKSDTKASEIIANADKEEPSTPPSQLVQQEKHDQLEKNAAALSSTPLSSLSRAPIDMRSQLIKAGAFSVLMLGLLALTLGIKWRQRKRATKEVGDAALVMKTLGTMSVASKQRLSLVQIGDEKILLGISPDQVTFLTAIRSESGPAYSSNPQPAKIPLPTKNSFANFLASEEDSEHSNNSSVAATMLDMASANKKSGQAATSLPASSDGLQNPVSNVTRTVKPSAKSLTTPRIPKTPPTASFQVAVGDDGVSSFSTNPTTAANAAKPTKQKKSTSGREPETVDDITKLIREKLRTYRKI